MTNAILLLIAQFSIGSAWAVSYNGSVTVDNGPGVTFITAGQCYLRVKGDFRCAKKRIEEDDLLVVLGPPVVTINFGGREVDEGNELEANCLCDDPTGKHTAKWQCDCPTPDTATASLVYTLKCKSKKSGLIETHRNPTKTYQVKCRP